MIPHSRSMAAWIEAKAARPDSLVLWRVGDFLEFYFEDARRAAPLLGLVMLSRGTDSGSPVPMCCVPVTRGTEALAALAAAGVTAEMIDGEMVGGECAA